MKGKMGGLLIPSLSPSLQATLGAAADMSNVLFASKPSSGAAILKVQAVPK